MSNDLNQCQFIGHLGRDPEVRYSPNGDACANFSIAVGESWKDKNSGEKQERTEWIRCVAWRKLGEIIGEYLRKGSQVYISGKMQTRKWQNKEGVDQYTTEIVVNQMQMLGGKNDGERREQSAAPAKTAPGKGGPKTPGGFNDMEDDIPFASCDLQDDIIHKKLRWSSE